MATAEPLRNAQALQAQLAEFQEVQRQLQLIAMQRQQLSFQLDEIKLAEAELEKSDKTVYRAIGPLIIEGTKAEILADLKERKELFEMRLATLAKQEEKLAPKSEELRATLEKALREGRAQAK